MGDEEPERFGNGEPPIQLVKDAPKFDLEAYISNYEGRTRLDRLWFLGQHSEALGTEALRMGLEEASQGSDFVRYLQFAEAYHLTTGNTSVTEDEKRHAMKIEATVQRETLRLENDLKGYKNNLIKESIRLGNDDMGQHLYRGGHFTDAYLAFSRMREYCTTPKHAAEMSLKLILAAIPLENWLNVQSNYFKLQNLTLKPEDKAKVDAVLAPIAGLASMAAGSYKEAANSFLHSDPAYATAEAVAGVRPSTQILTANDLAVYGGLCALATLSRDELTSRVLENFAFRSFLELESHLRRAIVSFCGAKYGQCLEILESYRTDYSLDLFLHQHVEPLYGMIRQKSIVAYCAPFSKVSFESLASTFAVDQQAMETELLTLVKSGSLKGRLDVVNKILTAEKEDKHTEVLVCATKLAEDHERALQLRLFKIIMQQEGFEIKSAPREQAAEGPGAHKAAPKFGR